ncbi:hypothetical protein M0R45_004898 [Rubus argutus]|uniref:Uncharacterized protein n=1 Tax=Rubus argutus TaxID=59490 RepID=A0AAW1YLH2_RUBAR
MISSSRILNVAGQQQATTSISLIPCRNQFKPSHVEFHMIMLQHFIITTFSNSSNQYNYYGTTSDSSAGSHPNIATTPMTMAMMPQQQQQQPPEFFIWPQYQTHHS